MIMFLYLIFIIFMTINILQKNINLLCYLLQKCLTVTLSLVQDFFFFYWHMDSSYLFLILLDCSVPLRKNSFAFPDIFLWFSFLWTAIAPFRQQIVCLTEQTEALAVSCLSPVISTAVASHPSVSSQGHSCYLNDLTLWKGCSHVSYYIFISYMPDFSFTFIFQVTDLFIWCQQIYQFVPFWGHILFPFMNSAFTGHCLQVSHNLGYCFCSYILCNIWNM